MEIDERLLRVLFDTAVGSMDFGSGFLDDEEVAALREVAGMLGADPMVATPGKFRCGYRGHHAAEPYLDRFMFDGPDGVLRNAYRRAGDFPPACQDVLKRLPGGLAMLDSPVIRMHCGDCGQQWDALDSIPRLRP